MRIFIYYDVKKINIKTMSDRSCGMCVTSNVLVIFISFEIYLMFEVVSEGRYSLMRIIDNPFFAFVVYVISSVLLGCILHFVVKYIKKYVL